MKQLTIVCIATVAVVGIISSVILLTPKDTSEQIIAKEKAKQEQLEAEHRRSIEQQKLQIERQKIEASRPASVQAADEVGNSIHDAAVTAGGIYIGGKLLDYMLNE